VPSVKSPFGGGQAVKQPKNNHQATDTQPSNDHQATDTRPTRLRQLGAAKEVQLRAARLQQPADPVGRGEAARAGKEVCACV
jgi:hypothetical protein